MIDRERPRRRPHGLAALVCALVALAVVLPPVASATTNPLHVFRLKFQKNGQTFLLEFRDTDDQETLDIIRTQTQDPEGVARIQRKLLVSFNLTGALRWGPEDNSVEKVIVDTGDQLGDWGQMSFTYKRSDPVAKSCNGHIRRAKVRRTSNDAFRFRGAGVRLRKSDAPGAGRVTYDDDECVTYGSTECDVAQQFIGTNSGDLDLLFAVRTPDRATVAAYRIYEPAEPAQNVYRTIVARLPVGSIAVAGDVKSGHVEGVAGTWIRGRFDASTANLPAPPEPSNCTLDGEPAQQEVTDNTATVQEGSTFKLFFTKSATTVDPGAGVTLARRSEGMPTG